MTVYYHAVQGLLHKIAENKRTDLLLKQIIQVCQHESACNGMVSLFRAITADAFVKKPEQWLAAVQNSTECARSVSALSQNAC